MNVWFYAILAIDAVICGILGAVIGANKNASNTGAFLGFLFGPLGMIAAFAVDHRWKCPECMGRLNDHPNLCQHCKTKLIWLTSFIGDKQPFTEEAAAIQQEQRKHRTQAAKDFVLSARRPADFDDAKQAPRPKAKT
jgi:hypothetical protein